MTRANRIVDMSRAAASGAALLSLAMLVATAPARAADLFADDVRTVLRSETFSVEASAGYATGNSTEYVYAPGSKARLSQLKWDIAGAAVAGGRVAFRPTDWLTVRLRGWGSVDADSKMRDYDWLAGFYGAKSFTHISIHPDTVTPQLWQGDASVALSYWQDGDVNLTAIAGYRHYAAKFAARGGSYIYSSLAYGDTTGVFTPGQAGITYRQTWDTPYLGLGLAYASGDWIFAGEVTGSPVVFASAEDDHHMRSLNIKSKFQTSSMVGLGGSLEYRLTDHLSALGRFEYQRFSEARGSARYADQSTGAVLYNPKPGSGADAETALLTLGLKARL